MILRKRGEGGADCFVNNNCNDHIGILIGWVVFTEIVGRNVKCQIKFQA